MMDCAPIALFVYNRPEHARRTIEALARNRLASQSPLVIFSDGARDANAAASVALVREQARSVGGFASVRVVERTTNLGLAKSIIDGVGSLCQEHGRVIVVEDDLVTSERFLEFMNDGLDRYADEQKVMHISGYMYPVQTDDLPETFFLPPASCWGWATWQRAWRHFDKNPTALLRQFSPAQKRDFNLGHSFPYWTQVELNAQGRMNTWAIFWYASVFMRGGLCLHPRQSFVQNIGHDDSGVHSNRSSAFDVALNPNRVERWCDKLKVDANALQRLQKYFRESTSLTVRTRLRLESMFDRFRTARAEVAP
jgi:GT2 family glycosyltransferase